MRRVLVLFLLLLAAVGAWQCARGDGDTDGPRVLLVSLDGWRWDYRDRMRTPVLDALAERGVTARKLQPAFPTKTFPNHYTLVTGLLPDHHGIVANTIHDGALAERFSLSNRAAVRDGRWWEGEPIWVRLERAGYPTAPYGWPGSEASIGGVRPTHWMPYRKFSRLSVDEQIRLAVDFFDRQRLAGPAFATLYVPDVDSAGHEHGPESAEVREAAERADAVLGRLFSTLDEHGLLESLNVVVVSDHGMAELDPERVIDVSDYLDPASVDIVDLTPMLGVWPETATVEEIYERLANKHPHLAVYRKAELPPYLQYGTHRRVPPVLALADEGWTITVRRTPGWTPGGGTHGYDHTLDSMQGLFVAAGPGLPRGRRVEHYRSVDLYELLCALLEIEPAPNDGDRQRARELVAPEAPKR